MITILSKKTEYHLKIGSERFFFIIDENRYRLEDADGNEYANSMGLAKSPKFLKILEACRDKVKHGYCKV